MIICFLYHFCLILVHDIIVISYTVFPFRQRANVELGENSTFMQHTVYKDGDTYIVIGAACEVLGECLLSDVFLFFELAV